MMSSLLTSLIRHSAAILAIAIFVGLLLPDLAASLRPAITPVIALLLFVAMLRIPLHTLDGYRRRVTAWVVAWLLVASPLIAWLVTAVIPLPGELRLPVILMCAAPALLSAPAMALLLRMDATLMLGIVAIASLLCPVTIALIPGLALQLALGIDAWDLFARFALLIGGSLGAAVLVRRLVGTQRLEDTGAAIDLVGLALLVVFAIGIMDGVTRVLVDETTRLLQIIVLVFAVNLSLQVLGLLVFLQLGQRIALTAAFASGNRNMAIWAAVLPLSAGSDTMLYIAAAQFPIFTLPLVLAPVYRRLLR